MEEIYYKIREKAFEIAMQILKNPDSAEDIAQDVALKFLQQNHEIQDPISWSFVVSKNKCLKQKKKQCKVDQVINEKQQIIEDDFNHESLNTKDEIDIYSVDKDMVNKFLCKKDFRVYKFYIKHRSDISKISRSLRQNKSSTYNSVFKMKKNLTASILQKNGWRGTKKIIDYNTHKKLINFIKKYLDCCKKNNLHQMKCYCKKSFDLSLLPRIEFKKTADFTFMRRKDHNYDFGIPFVKKDGKVNFVLFVLDKNLKKRLKIVSAKLISKGIYRLEKTELLEQQQKPLTKGLITESKEEMLDMIISLGGKIQD